MKNVTLKDVAKAAGVSYATVSRALSGSSQIGSETRERVLKLCDEMGYTTNFVARSMVTKRTNLIGLVVPSVDNQFMSELAYHAEVSARAHGYNIMLCDSGPDLKQEKTVFKLLLGRQVDGILIVPQSSKSYDNLKSYLDQVPTVFLSENLRSQPQSYVAVDNSRGTYLGTQYLYELGHRDILYFGQRPGSTTHQLRADGYMKACHEFNLTPHFFNSEYSRSSIQGGYQLAKELFRKPLDCTAVFAATDSNALGILTAADEMGIDIPGHLSLIGFDNISATALSRIDLTTVDLQQSGYGVVVSQRQTRISIGSHTFYQLWDQKGPVAVASVAVHFKGTVFQHPAHLVPFRKFSSGSLPCRLPRPVHAALPASLLRKLLWGRSPNWSRLRKLSVSAVADDGGHSPHIRRFYPEKALQS